MAEWSAPGIRNRKDGGWRSALSAVSVSPSRSLLACQFILLFSLSVYFLL